MQLKAMILSHITNKEEFLENENITSLMTDIKEISMAIDVHMEDLRNIRNGAKDHN